MSESDAVHRAQHTKSDPSAGTAEPGTSLALAATDSALVEERGKTSISETVVAKIAGIATREVGGVYDVGGTTERVVGRVRDALPGTTTSTTQGISVQVGERQAAIDVSIVADYGVAIDQLGAAIRRNVIAAIEQMTGLEVTEVNVIVHDIHFADDNDDADTATEAPRVQ